MMCAYNMQKGQELLCVFVAVCVKDETIDGSVPLSLLSHNGFLTTNWINYMSMTVVSKCVLGLSDSQYLLIKIQVFSFPILFVLSQLFLSKCWTRYMHMNATRRWTYWCICVCVQCAFIVLGGLLCISSLFCV